MTEDVNLALLSALVLLVLLLFARLEAFRIANKFPGQKVKFSHYVQGLEVLLGNLVLMIVAVPAAMLSFLFRRGRR
ncbi:hypothetical protein LCGC14_1666900 [marine sediment metagenome]|uniref:Uncharacterized protein n=1 Tax=marine sediment metagenome TaxID=412755 RepID=A0A0F9HSC6_9ZZZZ